MSSSAGQDCGSCGFFTLNFDPASVKYFVEKGISTTAFYFVLQAFIVWIFTKNYCFLATSPYKIF